MASQTEVEAFLRDLRKKGMPIHIDVRKKHIGIWHHGKMICVVGKTPGSQRWRDNVLTTLRRHGLELTEPKVLRAEARDKRKEVEKMAVQMTTTTATAANAAVQWSADAKSDFEVAWETLLDRGSKLNGRERGVREQLYRALANRGVGSSPAAAGVTVRNLLAGKDSQYTDIARDEIAAMLKEPESELKAELQAVPNGKSHPLIARMDKALRALRLENDGRRWKLALELAAETAKVMEAKPPILRAQQMSGIYRQLEYGGRVREGNLRAYAHVVSLLEQAASMRKEQEVKPEQVEPVATTPAEPSGLPLHLKVLQQLLLADADEDTIWNATFAVWRSEQ